MGINVQQLKNYTDLRGLSFVIRSGYQAVTVRL